MTSVKDFVLASEEIKKRVKACSTNAEKVAVYSDCELLVMDIEAEIAKCEAPKELVTLKDELSALSGSINLSYIKRKQSAPMKIINKIDEVVRLIAVWLILAVSSVVLAIPCILLSPVDFVLVNLGVISVYKQISVIVKLFLARIILKCSGIHVVIDGLKRESFGKECVLACFSHSSSMDAFLLTGAIPVTALTVVSSRALLPSPYLAPVHWDCHAALWCYLFCKPINTHKRIRLSDFPLLLSLRSASRSCS
jgi:hypothetical protein